MLTLTYPTARLAGDYDATDVEGNVDEEEEVEGEDDDSEEEVEGEDDDSEDTSDVDSADESADW